MARGALALVVGPSGAGKDSLIDAARTALKDDTRFSFPRRIVTRQAFTAIEDHDTLDRETFKREKLKGAFALDWEAHGLSYGLPASIESAMLVGRVVVANGSRAVIPHAIEKYERCYVLLVTAPADLRAKRLAARGRETAQEISARLEREGATVPAGVMPIVIDNSGHIDDGLRRFLKALNDIAK